MTNSPTGAGTTTSGFGRAGDEVFVGDWDGNGTSTFAVRRGNVFSIRNSVTTGVADVVFGYGRAGDEVLVGDWNDELTDAPRWNVFEPLIDSPETYRFLTLEREREGAHTYIPFEAMLDHILVTSDALDEYGEGVTEVLEIDLAMPAYRDLVSDHRPVVSRFAIR